MTRNFKPWVDLTGRRFGEFLVLGLAYPERRYAIGQWRCRCSCGTEKVLEGHRLRAKKPTKSCGCLKVRHCKTMDRSCMPRGRKHWRYQTVPSAGTLRHRSEQRLKVWRHKVRARNGSCVLCGVSELLEAHHLNSVDVHPGQMLDVNNGVTLCQPHHRQFHMRYGFGGNTREQFACFAAAFASKETRRIA